MNEAGKMKKRYEDERIIALRLSEQRRKFNSIETGIYLGNILYTFSERLLFDGTLRIMIPETFVSLPEEEARNKYLSESRPQVILSNEAATVNFTFSRFNKTASWDHLPGMMENFQAVILNVNPSILLLDKEQYQIKNQLIPGIEFKSYAMDGVIYNFVFLFLAGQNPVLGMFNSHYREMQDWKLLFVKCMETMEDTTEKGKG